jgi:hypothetical protein
MNEGTILVYYCPSTFSLTSPPLPKLNLQYLVQSVCGCGGWGVLSCVVDHILQDFFTLCFTDSESTKVLHHPKQK